MFPFTRSHGRLANSPCTGRRLATLAGCLLLAGWSTWFAASRVGVYAVSDSARLEVDRAPYPVESTVEGTVSTSALTPGRAVKAGELLVALDVRSQALDVGEEQARIGGLEPQMARVRAEIAAQDASHRTQQTASLLAEREARAHLAEAEAAATLAANTAQRIRTLARSGLTSDAELTRVEAEAVQKRAAADALDQAMQRIAADGAHDDTEHRVRQERLERELAELRAKASVGSATVQRLQHQQALRQIVAPVSGILAEAAVLPAGRVLRAGDAVATILPSGNLRIVALFKAAEAFGRVRPGQHARLRLDGFPPAQYGAVTAIVSDVARELRDGRVRVELELTGSTPSIPIQHGLPGSVEVEVERLSPAQLALRAIGRRLAASTTVSASTN